LLIVVAVDERQWPPRSPYEAILSSPSGRKKLQRQSRLSPSPSPRKRPGFTSSTQSQKNLQVEEVDDEEDEDEETLQLKLQALEAKLKLKKLQSKKAKASGHALEAENDGASTANSISRATSVLSSRREGINASSSLHRSQSTGNIQVPLSPERKPTIPQEQKSPGRVLLGIDKGLSARDVSLRRAPSLRSASTCDDPFGSSLRPPGSRSSSLFSRQITPESNRPSLKTFNERIAESRHREKSEREHHERIVRIRAQRSTSFGVRNEELAAFKEEAEKNHVLDQRDASSKQERAFSRDQILQAANKPSGGLVQRSNTVSSIRTERRNLSSVQLGTRPRSSASQNSGQREKPRDRGSVSLSDESRPGTPGDPSLFEGYSRTNLARRVLPHSFLGRLLEDKNAVTIPTLLRDIKAPDFELPPHLEEKDLVLFATIATKSAPIAHQTRRPQAVSSTKTAAEAAAESEANVNGNYMVFTLTDLQWTLDLYLFKTAFTRWRKLQPGTVIAILNPEIMPPPKGRTDTNRWSLVLNSSDDTVLEIGTSKDLSFCKAKKKDGNMCDSWVDGRKTEFCEFHIDRNVERARRGRMELQGMSAPFAPGGKSVGRHGFFGSTKSRTESGKDDGLLREGKQYDRSSHSTYFMAPQMHGRSAASLLDADEDAAMYGSREDRMRKLLAEREKERDIAKKLGESSSGAGAEYLRLRNTDSKRLQGKSMTSESATEQLDAKSLGLKSNNAKDVMLGPIKRKTSRLASNGSGTGDIGPQKKKTRFVTAKGIREAGRDSLPGEGLNLEQDDELEIT
jgi:minichromosome maintenance protein 10